MISRPKGSVQVNCAPRPEVNRPSAVPYVSPSAGAWVSSQAFSPVSISRNCNPMPSDTMIDGITRLATTTKNSAVPPGSRLR